MAGRTTNDGNRKRDYKAAAKKKRAREERDQRLSDNSDQRNKGDEVTFYRHREHRAAHVIHRKIKDGWSIRKIASHLDLPVDLVKRIADG